MKKTKFREQEFRAVYGGGKVSTNSHSIYALIHHNVSWTFEGGGTYLAKSAEIFELEYLEYTGLNDKNGKKMFEGDIVKFKRRDSIYSSEIVWHNGESSFALTSKGKGTLSRTLPSLMPLLHYIRLSIDMEVIGNKYEGVS